MKKATEAGKGNLSPETHATYREIVGAVLYIATVCRPDISVAVGLLSRALEYPNELTLAAAYRVLRYLVTTKVLGLRWVVGGGTTLSGMSDSNWAVVKSTSGYVFFLCQAAVAYISKKQASIAMSSTEAEIIAASACALVLVFCAKLAKEMGMTFEKPPLLFVDNSGAVELSRDRKSCHRSRHVDRRYFKVRELQALGELTVEHIPTAENSSDLLTKVLSYDAHVKHRARLLNLDPSRMINVD